MTRRRIELADRAWKKGAWLGRCPFARNALRVTPSDIDGKGTSLFADRISRDVEQGLPHILGGKKHANGEPVHTRISADIAPPHANLHYIRVSCFVPSRRLKRSYVESDARAALDVVTAHFARPPARAGQCNYIGRHVRKSGSQTTGEYFGPSHPQGH